MNLNTDISDIDMLKASKDENGYPIYMMFEVIHVQRKTLLEEQLEAIKLRKKLNQLVMASGKSACCKSKPEVIAE